MRLFSRSIFSDITLNSCKSINRETIFALKIAKINRRPCFLLHFSSLANLISSLPYQVLQTIFLLHFSSLADDVSDILLKTFRDLQTLFRSLLSMTSDRLPKRRGLGFEDENEKNIRFHKKEKQWLLRNVNVVLNNILGYEAYRLGLINIPFPKPVRGKLKIEKELIHRENEGILEVRTDGKPICSSYKNKCKTLEECSTKFQKVINIVASEKNRNCVERAMIFQNIIADLMRHDTKWAEFYFEVTKDNNSKIFGFGNNEEAYNKFVRYVTDYALVTRA